MAIFLPPILGLGLYYRKRKTQWVKEMLDHLQIIAQSMYV